MNKCQAEGCGRPAWARALCRMHHARWWRHSDPATAFPQGHPLIHGHACEGRKTPTYYSWRGMIQRCLNPYNHNFKYYGGRGIKVCGRWDTQNGGSFENFLADMGARPEGLTLERVDNDGDYEPTNCCWATWKEQRANRRFPVRAPARERYVAPRQRRSTARFSRGPFSRVPCNRCGTPPPSTIRVRGRGRLIGGAIALSFAQTFK